MMFAHEKQFQFYNLKQSFFFFCVFAGMVPEPKSQVAQTGKDGSSQTGLKRLRALDDDRFAKPNARVQPGPACRPVAVTASAVRTARFPVSSADRISELPDAAGGALRSAVVRAKVAAVATTTDHRHLHAAVIVLAVHVFVVSGVHCRSQDIVHSRAQAQGQRTRRVHHERHANGLKPPRYFSCTCVYHRKNV